MELHNHSDNLIKTCPICQKAIIDIKKAGRKLDKTGVWSIPKKIQKGKEYIIWQKN
jgi:hypothetical protein